MSLPVGIFFAWYLVFVFSATCHEAAHAWAALRGGDTTAYEGGQVSLDPFPHMRREPIGMIVVPVISFLVYGYQAGWENAWMLGWASAPYNADWGRRYPRRQAWMSLAGPVSNFLIAAVAFAVLKGLLMGGVVAAPTDWSFTRVVEASPTGNYGSLLGGVAFVLSITLILNVLLGVLNLMPFPPLDGAGVVEGFGPEPVKRLYEGLRETPMIAMIGLLVAWHVFPYVWLPVMTVVLALLY